MITMRCLIVFAGLVCPYLPAQDTVDESMQVELYSVRVRVTDKQGHPLRGLSEEQFELKVGRKDKQPVYFEEVDLGTHSNVALKAPAEAADTAIPPTVRRRSTVILFDSSTLSREAFEATRTSLTRFIHDTSSPDHRYKLIQLENNLAQLTPFTTDSDLVVQALWGMQYRGVTRAKLLASEKAIVDGLVSRARSPLGGPALLINQEAQEKKRHKKVHLRTYTMGLDAVFRMLAPHPGERSVLLVTGGNYLDLDTDQYLKEITRVLNTHNITIHSMLVTDPRKLAAGERSLLPGGGANFERMPFLGDGVFGADRSSRNSILENEDQRETGPDESARQTGGAFIKTHNHDKILEGLSIIEEQANHYYVLWYRSEENKHKVKLQLRDKIKGAKLRYGRRIAPSEPYNQLKGDDRKLEFLATLQYGPDMAGTFLPGRWQHHLFASGNQYQAAVQCFLSTDQLEPGTYEVGMALLNSARQALVVRHRLMSNLPQGQPLSFYEILNSGARPAYLSCTIRHLETDRLNQRVFELNPGEEGALSLSSVVLIDPRSVPPVRLSSPSEDEIDPFAVGGGTVKADFGSRFVSPERLDFFFYLNNRSESHPNQQIYISVVRDNQPLAVAADITHGGASANDASYFLGKLDVALLKPGPYTLYLKVVDGQQQIIGKQPFELLAQ